MERFDFDAYNFKSGNRVVQDVDEITIALLDFAFCSLCFSKMILLFSFFSRCASDDNQEKRSERIFKYF